MLIDIKDIIYLLTYVVSIVTIIMTFRHRLASNTLRIQALEAIISSDTGNLNLVDKTSCKENRDQIYKEVRRTENEVHKIAEDLKKVGKNITKIMFHFKIIEED